MASHIARDIDLAETFPDFHEESHGESFLDLAFQRFQTRGFYLLDEPESALSMQGQMTLARLVSESVKAGSQFVIATHSPFLMRFPEASINQFTLEGVEQIEFDEIPAVDLWKRFFADPISYYQRLLADN
jgi:predicted ATPase